MAGEDKPRGYLDRFGARLIDAGYEIIPIKRGSKAPPYDGWQKTRADHTLLASWLEKKYKMSGVGILTRKTPAVDLDILDEAGALHMEAFVRDLCGDAPLRIGMAPKRLLLFRSDRPFPKLNSKIFIDEWGNPEAAHSQSGKPVGDWRKIEILGDGQQFVAYAVHPDTKQPYKWIGPGPTKVRAADLPLLTLEMAEQIVAEFERYAVERGWEPKRGTALARVTAKTSRGEVDLDDPFAADAYKVEDLTPDEIRAKLMLVPGAEDYDLWLQIGMALYHQFEGEPFGLELWHEWSQAAQNYKADALDDKWSTFDITEKGRAPVTARLILKLAKEYEQELSEETFVEIRDELSICETLKQLTVVCEKIKHLEFGVLQRNQLVGLVQKQFKTIAKTSLTVGAAREMTRYESPRMTAMPHWLEGWIYATKIEMFYNIEQHRYLSVPSFNNVFDRFMLTKREVLEGQSVPETHAKDFALNNQQITVVENVMYLPGEDDLFWVDGHRYANGYDPTTLPDTSRKLTREDRDAIHTVEAHLENLFPFTPERNVLIDVLAFIVQNPGQRVNFAVLMQGAEGDGKSFVSNLLGCVIGASNINLINAETLEEKFNGWAERAQVVFVEEVKLQGHNRHDVLNKVKPNITNAAIPIRRMNTDVYKVINTITYILATNYRDALPLTDDDSRYFILFSRFQRRADVLAFMDENPDYYDRLFATLERPGALRKWLLDWKISPDFSNKKRAPMSKAKLEMIGYSRGEHMEALDELLETGDRMDISATLLDSTKLIELLADICESIPIGRAVGKLLLDAGFHYIGQVRMGDERIRYWSRTPSRFRDPNGKPVVTAIKAWLNPGL